MKEDQATTEVAQARATLNYARISARKVKIVADLIRGKSAEEALTIVKFAPKASAEILEKLLKSAIANAENNHFMNRSNLYVAEIYAKADDWANRSAYNKKKYTILLYDFAKFLFDFGFYDKAEQIYLRQIAMTKELYGNMSIITAIAYNNIGVIYHLQRNETKELEAYLEALRIYKELLDTDIPETATAYNNIGMVLANRGYYDKALEFHFISVSTGPRI